MEINEYPLEMTLVVEFKIDLIVWKFNNDGGYDFEDVSLK